MGLCYQTSKWSDTLWKRHTDHFETARQVIRQGERKHKEFAHFAEDLHARLYLRNDPPGQDGPQWAADLHKTATEIPEFENLRRRCHNQGLSAGIATERLLASLAPQSDEDGPGGENDPGEGEDTDGSGNGPGGTPGGRERRKMRQAVREATKAVDEAEQLTEALSNALGIAHGTAPGQPETIDDIDEARELYLLARENWQLKQIAELAGRLQRIARSHKRVKVSPGVGTMKGVTQGGDLARLLPSELVGMRQGNRVLRLQTVKKIIDRRALQYHMEGEEPLARGPLVVCVDESGSMGGRSDTFAKAVALALLATATEQRRTWHYIGFNHVLTHQQTIRPGEATASDIVQTLCRTCSGGTSFDVPLHAAMDAIEENKALIKSDIIFITDGISTLDPDTIARCNKARDQAGLSIYCIGIRSDVEVLRPIATEAWRVSNLDQAGLVIAPALIAE